jgi:hypothetical protein
MFFWFPLFYLFKMGGFPIGQGGRRINKERKGVLLM